MVSAWRCPPWSILVARLRLGSLRDINRFTLLFVIWRKILSVVPAAVISTSLDGSILQYACCNGRCCIFPSKACEWVH